VIGRVTLIGAGVGFWLLASGFWLLALFCR
jgi:hypothetical protein